MMRSALPAILLLSAIAAAQETAPSSTIDWRDDFDRARVEAKLEGKPLLVVFR